MYVLYCSPVHTIDCSMIRCQISHLAFHLIFSVKWDIKVFLFLINLPVTEWIHNDFLPGWSRAHFPLACCWWFAAWLTQVCTPFHSIGFQAANLRGFRASVNDHESQIWRLESYILWKISVYFNVVDRQGKNTKLESWNSMPGIAWSVSAHNIFTWTGTFIFNWRCKYCTHIKNTLRSSLGWMSDRMHVWVIECMCEWVSGGFTPCQHERPSSGGVFLLLENFFYNFFILEMRLYFSPFGGLINVLLKW